MTPEEAANKGATDKGKRQVCLENQAEFWDRQQSAWPTPARRDYRDPNLLSYQERSGSTKGEQLPNFVKHQWLTAWSPSESLRPAQAIRYGLTFWQRYRVLRRLFQLLKQRLPSPYNKASSMTKRRLSADFVDWLMGWPVAWSSAERVFSVAEMALFRCAQRSRLACLLGGLD